MTKVIANNRLMSIDVLRGFDLLMIIVADRFFYNLHAAAQTNFTKALADQFEHPEWIGFHLYDVIMPLFLFVVGVVIPFSLGNRSIESGSKFTLYAHILKRFIILFILGWIVQGNLLFLDISKFHVFSNTLQAIAVGYLFSCIAYLNFSQKGRYVFFASCLVLYAVLLSIPDFLGHHFELLPNKNLPIYIDQQVLGRFYDQTQYSWLLTGLGFTATTLSGLFAGELLLSSNPRPKIALYLAVIGVFGIGISLLIGLWHPIIKKIWTSSFVIFSSGISFVLLALFYWLVDVKGYKKWAYPFRVIGLNAIAAYVGSHVFNFSAIAKQIFFGFEQFTGAYYDAFCDLAGFAILYFILWYMHKNKTYVKV
ncbi:acyltransferase family protein [Flavobacterium notoginsengisoli]|uniref:acyltransferase family protein n=1 Tax=Flavobacterium notoginsengisoli TaxID=1478199 RepID=UPI0036383099